MKYVRHTLFLNLTLLAGCDQIKPHPFPESDAFAHKPGLFSGKSGKFNLSPSDHKAPSSQE